MQFNNDMNTVTYSACIPNVISTLDLFDCDSGTPALTSRGFVEEDFVKVAECFDAAVTVAVKIKSAAQGYSKPLVS